MTDFTIHTAETAPEGSTARLEGAQKQLGFVPNLYGVMAEAPKVLEAYQELGALYNATSLSAVEQNVVWLEINVANSCHYCVPAHTAIAKTSGVSDYVTEALRTGAPIADEKLEALRQFTRAVVDGRGRVSDVGVEAFLAAGYTKQQILEVVLGVAHKTISNYINHLADTPVDDAFAPFTWTPVAQAAE